MRNKNCLLCKKPLTKNQYWKKQKYCSCKCSNRGRRILKYCDICNILLTRKQRHNKYCSRKCYGIWLSKQPPRKMSYKTKIKISIKAKKRIGKKSSGWKNANINIKCIICNKNFKRFKSKINRTSNKIPVCSRKCANILQKKYKFHKGENNANWQGGISKLPYPFYFDTQLKKEIRQRDNHTCQKCGCTQKEELNKNNKKLTIHHIDYNKENCSKSNLITLCNKCNLLVNWDRKKWQQIFQKLVKQINALVHV